MMDSSRSVVASVALVCLVWLGVLQSAPPVLSASGAPALLPYARLAALTAPLPPALRGTGLVDRLRRRPIAGMLMGMQGTQPEFALRFDGVDDRVTFGAAPDLGASTFTLEVWFKREGPGVTTTTTSTTPLPIVGFAGATAAVPLLTKGRHEGETSNLDMNYFLGIENTRRVLAADFEDNVTGANHPVYGVTRIYDGIWYHAAATYDGNKWQLFLNGNLEGEETVGLTPRFDSIQHAGLGTAFTSTGAPGGFFKGQLDEARIWNVARAQGDIQLTMGSPLEAPQPGLIGRWALDEGSGTSATNSAGGADGRLAPTPPPPPAAPPVWVVAPSPFVSTPLPTANYGLRLMGPPANDYVSLGAAGGPGTASFTVETWFRREGVGSATSTGTDGLAPAIPLVTKGRAESAPDGTNLDMHYFLGIDNATNKLVADFEDIVNGGNHPVLASPTLGTPIPVDATPRWHHAAATYDGTTWRLYLDGVLDREFAVGAFTPRFDSIQHAALGSALTSAGAATGSFAGTLDEVRIWNYARSSAQIASGKDREIVAAPGLVAHYNFNDCCGPVPDLAGPPFENGTQFGSSWTLVTGQTFTGAPNAAPVVDAGPNQTIVLPGTAALTGSVVDDGFSGAPVALTWSKASGPGIVTFDNPTGSSTAATIPTPGTYELTLTANDGELSASDSITVDVNAVNEAPVANDQAVVTDEDTAQAIMLGGSDLEGSALTYAIGTGPAHGTLSDTAPNLIYTPAANYNGADSFTFTVNDGSADSNVATVSIIVNAVNDAPAAANDSYSATEDTLLPIASPGVLGNDTDTDGTSLTALLVAGPGHGTLTLNTDGSFTYAPAPNYNGPDSFTYRTNDGSADSNVATVSIAVLAVNDAPTAANDSYEAVENTTLTAGAAGVLGNDSDIDSGPLTAIVASGPAHGTLALSPDGSFTYVPAADYVGIDTFTYAANDGSAGSIAAMVTIMVNAEAVVEPVDSGSTEPTTVTTDKENGGDGATPSDPVETAVTVPAGVGGQVSIRETVASQPPPAGYAFLNQQINITAPPASPDNPLILTFQLDASIVSPGQNENTLQIFRNGLLVANCDAGAGTMASPDPCISSRSVLPDGDLEFTVRTSVASAWNIGTTTANTAPIAEDDSYSVDEDDRLTVASSGVLANDTDADGNTLTAVQVSGPSHGTLTLNANGSFSYTPAANYNGSDSFSYDVSDGTSNSIAATVTIQLTAVNDSPVAQDQSVQTRPRTWVPITLMADDAEGDPLTFRIISGPEHGRLSGAPPNLSYRPRGGDRGPDSFTFVANDGDRDSNVATVEIMVSIPNDPPVADSPSFTTNEDTPVRIHLRGSDPNGEELRFRIVSGPEHGTLTHRRLSGEQPHVIYRPAPNNHGPDSFTVHVSDGKLVSDEAVVAITVEPVNDTPVASNLRFETSPGMPVTGHLVAFDVDGHSLTYQVIEEPRKGKVTIDPATGAFSYTMDPGRKGGDQFTYTANDGTTDGNIATVRILRDDRRR